jgi:spore germination protein YaaH
LKKRAIPILAAVVLIVIVAVIGITTKIIEKYMPTDERMDLKQYFKVEQDDELALVLQNQVVENKGRIYDGVAYIDYDTIRNYLNPRFYWDKYENILIYTTPTDSINVEVGKKDYSVSKAKASENYTIVKVDGDKTYVAAEFVQKYTNMDFELFTEPNRLVIQYIWGKEKSAEVKKTDEIRFQGGVKSPIVASAAKGDKLTVLEELDNWTKVVTDDGCIGYIPSKKLSSIKEEEKSREFEEFVYTSLTKDTKINLVWHAVSTMDANNTLLDMISNTKGLTTIAPTWFTVSDSNGNINSLADNNYVTNAHAQGLEVWGVVTDFSDQFDININEILPYTSKRENLTNQLIAAAINYNLNGINIDFEKIALNLEGDDVKAAGDAYIQFIRELSIKCRKNGIILSIDNPVPQPYNSFYNRKEQGIVADYVINMGYDEYYDGSPEPGPVASLSFVRDSIEANLEEGVPANKLINAMPFYARIWTKGPNENGEEALTSIAVGMDEVNRILAENNAEKNWSEDTSTYYAEYESEDGVKKTMVWVEEEESIDLKAQLVKEFQLGGVASWRLGLERSSIWDIIIKYVN